ncbi:hypothetical protein QJS10_CPB11g02341 [Acorus calamus]|uniref:BRO1 domain-containing protein n=1 Tax=Acorus calamus TaxID=4465 RepID=A0AAV9DR12_ACOCL|nr:hypothetical protein QJS10_CPB11g02341 [Acorus calamus]
MPGNIGEVAVFVPGLRIPKSVDFSFPLAYSVSKGLVERLSVLRTRIVVMASQEAPKATRPRRRTATQHGGSSFADLLQALEDYLPVLLGLIKEGSQLDNKIEFVWFNQEDEAEETAIWSAWYEVLSVLHLMAMLCLSEANLLLLPKTSSDGYQPKVSEENRRNSVDIFLKAAGYLECAVQQILPRIPPAVRSNLPVDLEEGVLRALCLQALGQAQDSIMQVSLNSGWGQKHRFFVKWKYSEAKESTSLGNHEVSSEKIPKDTSSKLRINRDLYSHDKIIETAPVLPDFALALKPDEYQLPALDPAWEAETTNTKSQKDQKKHERS